MTNIRQIVYQREYRKRMLFALKVALYSGLLIASYYRPNLQDQIGIPANLYQAIFTYITFHLVIAFARLSVVAVYLKKEHLEYGIKNNFILGINRIASVAGFVVFFFSVLMIFGIQARTFFTTISIVAAAVAILSKDYISNVINGMIMMFSNQFSLNDYVKLGPHKGYVEDITLLHVQLINDDEESVYIPNNTVFNNEITNFSRKRIPKMIVEAEIENKRLKNWDLWVKDYQQLEINGSDNILTESQKLKITKINKEFSIVRAQAELRSAEHLNFEKTWKSAVNQFFLSYDPVLELTDNK
ncbi:MAG: mechanosensitive ion channel family protein [Cyclobacteriaceae bacterium]|nr:mechanosensitive ion channel [Cyclobacteriaceae bacterium]MCH8515632.1 mechanosensitive ion channel family protein [Cyclobacteriaceae bacterium]